MSIAHSYVRLTILAIYVSSILGFSAPPMKHDSYNIKEINQKAKTTTMNEDPNSLLNLSTEAVIVPKTITKVKGPAHKNGVFTPLVFAAKNIMGDNELKKFRAKMISYHSSIIKEFVDTHKLPVGQTAVIRLFDLMDQNGDGSVDKAELKDGLQSIGFSWLEEKEINGIVRRADANNNEVLEFDEFASEVPKMLKTNLLKLAKKNGDDMGLLV
eukprot:CAMPEP_0198252630 /NCGR_PEP_ID=MMETSP1447-20131203/3115_1 /TAXON_ID=420782 /ORGANISM="Chaetoceros dichaeta, Strain CCMP1751" /LENGTH=212 /DNA_ID=CAMNT_0043937957 /DNA_START=16 /DNA_END=654 /DNA_ORIENTATION=-